MTCQFSKPEEKRILGLDPGLARLGFGSIVCQVVPDGQKFKQSAQAVSLLDFGIVETTSKQPLCDRLCTLYDDLHALIREIHPDLVAIEKFFFYRMSNTINVAQARGVVLLVVGQVQLPYLEFTPAQIKQALTGYGNADKSEVQEAVARELDLETLPQPDDAADALAVALTAWFSL